MPESGAWALQVDAGTTQGRVGARRKARATVQVISACGELNQCGHASQRVLTGCRRMPWRHQARIDRLTGARLWHPGVRCPPVLRNTSVVALLMNGPLHTERRIGSTPAQRITTVAGVARCRPEPLRPEGALAFGQPYEISAKTLPGVYR